MAVAYMTQLPSGPVCQVGGFLEWSEGGRESLERSEGKIARLEDLAAPVAVRGISQTNVY